MIFQDEDSESNHDGADDGEQSSDTEAGSERGLEGGPFSCFVHPGCHVSESGLENGL